MSLCRWYIIPAQLFWAVIKVSFDAGLQMKGKEMKEKPETSSFSYSFSIISLVKHSFSFSISIFVILDHRELSLPPQLLMYLSIHK
jgi:hypothetical protein